MTAEKKFAPGSLISVRGREWVVQPPRDEDPEMIFAKPIDGSEEEATGFLPGLDEIESAVFERPDPEFAGDGASCSLLRDALRLNIRDAAGPFRSFGRINVEPRPYQLVPLLLALRQETPRLLIADDVGVGKTIETGLILRELVDRGEVDRFCILCPPYLAEQWERELYEKFNLETTIILPGTINRLERDLSGYESVFDAHKRTIVSIDFIKGKRSAEFLRSAPDMIVIDEAHCVANDLGENRSQRYDLARRLCDDPNRGALLVTATPHSGKDGAFRSLLGLLNKDFLEEELFPTDLSGEERRKDRERLAQYFIMRRRGDIKDFLETTDFPTVKSADFSWEPTPRYRELMDATIEYAKALVNDPTKDQRRKTALWWTALGLLRAVSSSPAAAEVTFGKQKGGAAPSAEEGSGEEPGAIDSGEEEKSLYDRIEKEMRLQALDADPVESEKSKDFLLSAALDVPKGSALDQKREAIVALASGLKGAGKDPKLDVLVEVLKKELKDGYSPIVFCRFINTAAYLKDELARIFSQEDKKTPKAVVACATGLLPPEERERIVEELGEAPRRILVCTDCLSEGINLQEYFDETIHYDLSWNPTRHDQREGRVNRFGQPSPNVRVLTIFGSEGIDGLILEKLLDKHRKIKNSLGISVQPPADSSEMVKALVNAYLLRGTRYAAKKETTLFFPEFMEETEEQIKQKFKSEWDAATERVEKRSRTYFAHLATSRLADAVKRELQEAREQVGGPEDVKRFVTRAVAAVKGRVEEISPDVFVVDVKEAREMNESLRSSLPDYDEWRLSFNGPHGSVSEFATRAHPFVSGLANYTFNTALDSAATNPIARRCGAIKTDGTTTIAFALLLRLRYRLLSDAVRGGKEENSGKRGAFETLVEETRVLGMEGFPGDEGFRFLSEEETKRLLESKATANIGREEAKDLIRDFYETADESGVVTEELKRVVARRAEALSESNNRARNAVKSGKVEVKAEEIPDIIGVYVYSPDQSRC